MNLYYQNLNTSIGELAIAYTEDYLVKISFKHLEKKDLISFRDRKYNIIKENKNNEYTRELEEYLSGNRKYFDIKYKLYGSEFSLKAWKELEKIKYGEVKTYKEVAEGLGGSNYSRAVGMVNSHNPIPIIVPCHRVIRSDGSLGGFFSGPEKKLKLLEIEGIDINQFKT